MSNQVNCVMCKTLKQQSNHWYIVASMQNTEAGIVILGYKEEGEKGWAESTQVFILCGEACVLKLVSRLLGERNVSRLEQQRIEESRKVILTEKTEHRDS